MISQNLQSEISQDFEDLPKKAESGFKCVFSSSEAGEEADLFRLLVDSYKGYSVSSKNEDSDVLWLDRPIAASDLSLVKDSAFINRVPGTEFFRHKSSQYKIMNLLKQLLPSEFAYHPVSYSLMKEFDLFQTQISENPTKPWIGKPSDGWDGNNVFIFRTLEELQERGIDGEMVVQEYITNPLTLFNKKWDLRLYLIIHGINPMRGYVSVDNGFGRFWVDDYDPDDTSNPFSNVTNSAINSKSDKFVTASEPQEGDDRVLGRYYVTKIWELIKEQYPEADLDRMKQQILDISNGILKSFRSSIEAEGRQLLEMQKEGGQNFENDKHFQILGTDIMFDDNFKAWLIETNRYPSLKWYYMTPNEEGVVEKRRSVVDENVKRILFHECFKILVGKEESQEYVKWYDSEEENRGFLTERVEEVTKKMGERAEIGSIGGLMKEILSVLEGKFGENLPNDDILITLGYNSEDPVKPLLVLDLLTHLAKVLSVDIGIIISTLIE